MYPGSAASTFTSIAALPVSASRAAKTGPQNGDSEYKQRSQTHATPSRLTDPGMQRASLVKAQIFNLLQLLAGNGTGGGDSEQDWDEISCIRGAVDTPTTGACLRQLRHALQVSKDSLDPQKQFSAELIKVIDTCLLVNDVV